MVARELDVSQSRDDPSIVYVNVYDMVQELSLFTYLFDCPQTPKNKYVYPLGMGVYHSGVEVYGMGMRYIFHNQVTW